MYLQEGRYYHLYNRSNNREIVFKEEENYHYFLSKYREHCETMLETLAFCLMPNHFHFLVRCLSDDPRAVSKHIAVWLSGYTKALNKRFNRYGNLFQQHSKAKEITDESHLITVVAYIHQNPFRGGLVSQMDDWPHSSYRFLASMNRDEWAEKSPLNNVFASPAEFVEFSSKQPENVKRTFWV